jgi:hypothetical protein
MTEHISERDRKLILFELQIEIIGKAAETANSKPEEYSYKKYGYNEIIQLINQKLK